MSISFYNDLHFIGAQEAPRCQTTIDRAFGPTIALNLIWRGRIHFAVEGEPSTVLTGPMAYWTWDGPRFLYGNMPGCKWHQLWVHAGGERARRMVEGGLVPAGPMPWSKPDSPEEFLAKFRHLIALVNGGRTADHAERVQLLEHLFLEASGSGKPGASGSSWERIASLSERIAAEPAGTYDFAREARLMGLSYHHFRRLFTEQIGRAPQAYLIDCRMRWAASRLTTGAGSVKAVAYAAGFADPRSFARQFRSRTGVAPHTLLAEGGWKEQGA